MQSKNMFGIEKIEFNNDVANTENVIDRASSDGDIVRLEKAIQGYGLGLKYTNLAIDEASRLGQVEVLEWWLLQWKTRGLPMKYTENAIAWASQYGEIRVLEWWKKNKGEVRMIYTKSAIDNASRAGEIKVMNWWADSGLEIKYSKEAINWASKNGDTEMLGWWKENMLRMTLPVVKRETHVKHKDEILREKIAV